MSAARSESRLKTMVDLGLVGENIMDIADFAVEKYEFSNDVTLSDSDRERALERVRDDLWERVKRFRDQRKQWQQKLFTAADQAVRDAVEGS